MRAALNESTLMLVSGRASLPTAAMAEDIAVALSDTDNLRIVPLASSGGVEALRDLLFLRGTDAAIVPLTVLTHPATAKDLGNNLPQRLTYIARLFNEDIHVLVGARVQSLEALGGQKVATLVGDGDARFAAADLFPRLEVDVSLVEMDLARAIEAVRAGEIGALFLVGGTPIPPVAALPKDGSIRLLGLPLTKSAGEGYSPAAFRSDDYPGLLPPGHVVDTLAVGTVLVASTGRGNDDMPARLERFVSAFMDHVSDLVLQERHPKWREVNLAASLAGFTRHPAAVEWLDKAKGQQAGNLKKTFELFLRSRQKAGGPKLTAQQEKALLEEFTSWTRKSVGNSSSNAPR